MTITALVTILPFITNGWTLAAFVALLVWLAVGGR